MSSALERLKNLTKKISSYELSRQSNIRRLEELFLELHIDQKVEDFKSLFKFKAINLSGVSLSNGDLGSIKEGKYLQILAISYDKNAKVKSKNVSLAYFGRVEAVESELKDAVVEFVLRYRFEKSFMTLEHYHEMLESFGSQE